MALPGETIHLGAPRTCQDCGQKLYEKVMRSPAGWYIGTECDCGPYSRESEYYEHYDSAKGALDNGTIKYREANFNG